MVSDFNQKKTTPNFKLYKKSHVRLAYITICLIEITPVEFKENQDFNNTYLALYTEMNNLDAIDHPNHVDNRKGT